MGPSYDRVMPDSCDEQSPEASVLMSLVGHLLAMQPLESNLMLLIDLFERTSRLPSESDDPHSPVLRALALIKRVLSALSYRVRDQQSSDALEADLAAQLSGEHSSDMGALLNTERTLYSRLLAPWLSHSYIKIRKRAAAVAALVEPAALVLPDLVHRIDTSNVQQRSAATECLTELMVHHRDPAALISALLEALHAVEGSLDWNVSSAARRTPQSLTRELQRLETQVEASVASARVIDHVALALSTWAASVPHGSWPAVIDVVIDKVRGRVQGWLLAGPLTDVASQLAGSCLQARRIQCWFE